MSLLGNCRLGSLWRSRGGTCCPPYPPAPYYYLGYFGAVQTPFMPPPPPPPPPPPQPQPWYWSQPSCSPGVPAPMSPMPPMMPLVVLPKELQADPTTASADAIVGGSVKVQPYVEYISAGSGGTPNVKVTTTVMGVVTTWDDSAITDGYHVKSDLAMLPPGAKLHIEATDAVLRVRWLEITGPVPPTL